MTMQDLTGRTLGQYQLRELIGAGGMGAVYRGYQTTLERAVAVKVLSTVLASESGYVERFYREAKTSAQLEHTHIVPVHDFGIQGNLSYVVMRLLTGGTLAERMNRRAATKAPLPSLGEVSSLLQQMASALDYAHSKSVIHRDIKPSNIMFDNQGNAYLVDFGIAKLLEATSALTGTGTTMGTPAFMPPEQWRSEELTATADQYALAATIYALMLGRTPYEATTPFGLMHKHLNEMPTPPHVERADVPEAVTLVMERALAKDPTGRFPTVTAFAQAFDSSIRGQTGAATGFFVAKLPPKEPPTLPTVPVSPLPAASGAGPTPPPAATASPQSPADPSVAYTPAPAARPPIRSPLVWGLTIALLAAIVVIGVLIMSGGGDEDDSASLTPGASIPAAAAQIPTDAPTATVTPTNTPTDAPTNTRTNTPTEEPSATPTDEPTATSTATRTVTPSLIPSATPSATPSLTRTITPSTTPSATPTDEPTPTPDPTATPTATPEPTDTAQPTAVAAAGEPTLVIGGGGTYMRSDPSIDASPQRALSEVALPILGVSPDREWYLVEYEGRQGWIRRAAGVRVEGDLDAVPVIGAEPAASPAMLIVGGGGTYMRSDPSIDASPQRALSEVVLPILGVSPDREWYLVEYEGRQGWIRRAAGVSVEGDLDAVPVIGPEPAASRAMLIVGGGGTYMRSDPSIDAPPQRALAEVALPILGISPDREWYLVEYEGREGWIRRAAGVSVEGDLDAVPVIEPEPAASPAMLVIGPLGTPIRTEPRLSAPQRTIASVELPILGISPDRNWYLVEYGDQQGWIRNSVLVLVTGDLDAVPVVEPGMGAANEAESVDLSARTGGMFVGLLFVDRFERGALANWSSVEGEMRLEQEEDENTVMVLSGANGGWAEAAPRREFSGDYSLSARVKVVRPQREFGDVYLRVRTAETYGVDTFLSFVRDQVGIGYWHDPDWTSYDEVSVSLDTDQWYHLRTDVIGDGVKVFVNGRLVASARIPGLGDGGLNLGASPGSVIWVDDVIVLSLDHSRRAMRDARRARVAADVNVRLQPGPDSPVIAGVAAGDDVFIVSDDSGNRDWLYVRQDETGVQGWIAREFLELVE